DINLDVPKYVNGDQRKVRQVLINLLGNAVKFTQQGRVSLSAKSAEAGVRFAVADSGPGIPPEQIGLILEPYRQLPSATLEEGTGLGLTITRHHVKLMGGKLDVVSSLGEGSEFTVTLPLRAVSGAAALAETAQQTIVGIAGGRKYSILVVDDDRNTRAFLSRRLCAIGFDTDVAENGLEAVQQFEAGHPDVILMDIGMPIMDGIEATRIIRSKEGGGAPKIVAVTAAAFVQNQEEILAAGCDGVVIKPFDERELLNTIAQEIGVEYVYGSPAPPSAPKALDWAGIQASLSPDIVVSLNNCLEMGNLDALRELAAGLAQSTEEAPARFGEYLLDCLHRSADGEIGSALNRICSVEPAECTPVRTILLIDDEAPIRMLTRRLLESEGFKIVDAGDGASGVELCTAHAPDLHCVLLDMIMPGMNGEEALYKLREIRGDLPVIIISGRSEEAADSLVSRHEGVSFLPKPFTLETLMEKVRGIS
ncbi:MAG: response regulator, partial [SAR324 cluster bacterium]|nr:response regulator [SAR324 cluster bacterium]